MHSWFQNMILLVITFWYRTGNDQRSPGIIDQNAIGLINHSKMMFALHHFFRRMNHVIAEVIKAKFIIGAVSDISEISFSPVITVWLVLINTINSYSKPLKNSSVPFLVAASQIIIYCYNTVSYTHLTLPTSDLV